jgi:hypothetical protein
LVTIQHVAGGSIRTRYLIPSSLAAVPRRIVTRSASRGPAADPLLVDIAGTATDNEIVAERLRVAATCLACKRRQQDLAAFV